MWHLSTAFDNSMIFIFKTPILCRITEYQLVSLPYSFPESLIMMCVKILLALLQSAIHLRDVGTQTETASDCKCVLLSVCVCGFLCFRERRALCNCAHDKDTECVSEIE